MYIDCHVHCRDFYQRQKETIERALSVAYDCGLDAIFDMPNTSPPITSMNLAANRMEIAKWAEANKDVFYGLFMGVTANAEQLKEVVETCRRYFPRTGNERTGVIGSKMFAGKSVGDLAIVDEEKQELVYAKLADLGYEGVLAVHCEKKSEMKPELWNPREPWTHADARPEIAETESIKDQIRFAEKVGYKGRLHICHVSTPESVDLVRDVDKELKISCGVTPHHLLLDTETMIREENGILYRVNPPLRRRETRGKLLAYFLDGKIDILESDHAPHTRDDKLKKHMSGIPNLASWPDFISILGRFGLPHDLLDKMTFDKVNEIFGTKIQRRNNHIVRGKHVKEYVFNPYECFEKRTFFM